MFALFLANLPLVIIPSYRFHFLVTKNSSELNTPAVLLPTLNIKQAANLSEGEVRAFIILPDKEKILC